MLRIYSVLIISVFMFLGCSSKTATTSLFDLNNEYDVDGSPFSPTSQIRMLSINGLSPLHEVGEVYFLHPIRGSQSAIELEFDYDKGDVKLKKTIIKYEPDNSVNLSELITLKANIQKLQKKSDEILSKRVEISSFKLKDSNVEKNQNEFGFKLKALNEQYKGEELSTKKIELEKKYSALLVKPTGTLTALEGELSTLTSEYNSLLNTYLEKNYKNILVFKWTKNSESSAKADASAFGNMGGSGSKNLSGYVIASGVTIEKLILNKNLAKELNEKFNSNRFWGSKVGIVSYALKVKDFVFVNDQDSSLDLGLLLKTTNLQDFSTEIKKLDELSLQLDYNNKKNISSFSQFSAPTITKIEIQKEKSPDNITKITDPNRMTTLFAVVTLINNLEDLFKE
ncbi:hypothetical protein KKG81_10665 [bacterium]|jgi:hypothetical protein|nr:hypothetical protein [bacterium]